MTETIVFEDILEQAQSTADPEKQFELIGLIQAILNEECSARATDLEKLNFYSPDPDESFIHQYKKNSVNPIDGKLTIIKRSGEAGYKRRGDEGSIQIPNEALGHKEIKIPAPILHGGIDILAKPDTKVQSVLDGKIVEFQSGFGKNNGKYDYSNTETGKYGNYIVIEHQITGETIRTKYAHLAGFEPGIEEKLRNKEQVEVKRGQTIGYVGMTGNAANEPKKKCHLHFEIHDIDIHNGEKILVDPTILHQVKPLPEK